MLFIRFTLLILLLCVCLQDHHRDLGASWFWLEAAIAGLPHSMLAPSSMFVQCCKRHMRLIGAESGRVI